MVYLEGDGLGLLRHAREQLQQASAALQKVCDSSECCTQLGQLVFGDTAVDHDD